MKDSNLASNSRHAWKSQDHAPKGKSEGVGAYAGSQSINQSEYSVKDSHDAYEEQAHAPEGKGGNSPTNKSGKPISGWDMSVNKGMAYSSQSKWDDSVEQASLGFKTDNPAYKHVSHFMKEEYLRQGHNDLDDLAKTASDFFSKASSSGSASKSSSEPKDSDQRASKTRWENKHGKGSWHQGVETEDDSSGS